MPENLFDDLSLMPLDEADDPHLRAASGTAERIRFVNLLDEGRPALARLLGAGTARRLTLWIRRSRYFLCFGPQAPVLVRVPSVTNP